MSATARMDRFEQQIAGIDPMLSIRDLKRAYNVKSDSTIYTWVKQGKLPKPRRVGLNRSRWMQSEIIAHMGSCPLALNEAA